MSVMLNNTLMLVTNRQGSIDDYLKFIDLCARSGITSVQLREKNASLDFIISFGFQLKALLETYGLPLIVNDSLEAALKIDAHGLHLGQTDGDPVLARKELGNKKIIGVSVTSLAEARDANNLPINYIGVGPVFNTTSKADAKPALGIDMLKKIISISNHPVIAIGGIDEENVELVASCGVQGIAVIHAIHKISYLNSGPARNSKSNILEVWRQISKA